VQIAALYDVRAALDLLEATGFPDVEGWLGPAVRGEVSATEATDAFESRRGSS
jgi:hypothetical protein